MKTKRLVISILGMLALTAGVSAIGGYTALTTLTSNKKDTVELVAAQKAKNTKELSVKNDSEEEKNKTEDTSVKEEEEPASETEQVEETTNETDASTVVATTKQVEQLAPAIVYDGMTMDQLVAKLNRSLNSTLAGQGYAFAAYSLELGVDPYVAVAIALHETGCKWNCSTLVKQCNNVGGMKGGPSCGGGAYKAFPTLDAGIRGYIENLSRNYYAVGLTTPELMNSKYASSPTWASKVNAYVSQIRAA